MRLAPIQFQKLFEGEYTDSPADQAQIRAIWTCLDKSLRSFSNYTRGEREGVYTAKELQLFANRYLPDDQPLTLAFTNAVFKLKRSVLGGNDGELTRPEVARLRDKLNRFGDMILPLAPHMAILLDPSSNQGSTERIMAATALNKFVMNVGDLLGDSSYSMQWKDLGDFVNELEKYTRRDKPTALTYVREQLGIFQYFKLLLVGGDEMAIENTKWRPIFEAISHFFNALYLSNNTIESFDQLSIEVKSNEDEQRVAVEKLNTLLAQLRNDPTLVSASIIHNLADRWGKALVFNALLFPRNQGSIALKTFLGSPGLRKLAGYLLDQMKNIKEDIKDPAKLQGLADNLANFIEQSSIANSGSGNPTPISFESLKSYVQQLKPLFDDEQSFQAILLGVDLFKNVAPVLCGKESDSYLPKDMRAVIQKAVDLYLAWRKESTLSVFEAIGQSIDIMMRPPALYSAKLEQAENTINLSDQLIKLFKIETTVDLPQIYKFIKDGFYAKSLVFGSSDKTINGFEIKTLGDIWQPFRTYRTSNDLAPSLERAAAVLQDNSFAPASLEKLIPAIDAFLPKDMQIERMGLDAKMLGLVKAALTNGSAENLERQDYPILAEIGAKLWARLGPVQKSLPKDFKIGMNAKSLELAAAGIDGIVDADVSMSYDKLRPLIATFAKQQGYPLRDKTLELLLVGMNSRIFGRTTGPKPERATGVLTSKQLATASSLLKKTQSDWLDIETVYAGVADTATLNRIVLNQRLKTQEIKDIIRIMPPLLDGKDHLLHISGFGAGNEFYAFDLAYKTLMRRVVQWLFPAYQIENDDGKASGRLTYNDVVDLLTDINELILDMKLTYGVNPAPVTATKRMQTINLFTKSGNGDDYLDVDETTEFLTISAGGKVLLDNSIGKLVKDCGLTIDPNHQVLPYKCLTNSFSKPEYFKQTYSAVIPEMVRQFGNYKPKERADFIESMLNATDAKWRDKKEMTFSDFEVFIAVPYYAENIFERLDADHNQTVVFSEAMKGFPLFCREIQKIGGSSLKGSCEPGEAPRNIEAVYGHLLVYGEPPDAPKPNDAWWVKLVKVKRVLFWFRSWKRNYRYRTAEWDQYPPLLVRKDVLQIISNLAMATDSPSDYPDEPGSDGTSE